MNVKTKRKLITSLIVVVVIVFLSLYLINKNPLDFAVKDITRIEIRNGTTGKQTVLKNEKAKKLSDELEKLDFRLAGIDVWSLGYRYKVKIITSDNSKEVVVKSENTFVTNIFKYESQKDLVKLIEDVITK